MTLLLFTNCEVHTAKYSESSFEYFRYGTNNWLIRALFYCCLTIFAKLSENFRKTDKISFKAHFCENQEKHYQKNFTNFREILGEFSIHFWQSVSDSDLNKYPTILVPMYRELISQNTLGANGY